VQICADVHFLALIRMMLLKTCKWKKNEWKTLPPYDQWVIKRMSEVRIGKLEWIAMHCGINAIYPSNNDELNYKERPHN
jgi:hypothetical protein